VLAEAHAKHEEDCVRLAALREETVQCRDRLNIADRELQSYHEQYCLLCARIAEIEARASELHEEVVAEKILESFGAPCEVRRSEVAMPPGDLPTWQAFNASKEGRRQELIHYRRRLLAELAARRLRTAERCTGLRRQNFLLASRNHDLRLALEEAGARLRCRQVDDLRCAEGSSKAEETQAVNTDEAERSNLRERLRSEISQLEAIHQEANALCEAAAAAADVVASTDSEAVADGSDSTGTAPALPQGAIAQNLRPLMDALDAALARGAGTTSASEGFGPTAATSAGIGAEALRVPGPFSPARSASVRSLLSELEDAFVNLCN